MVDYGIDTCTCIQNQKSAKLLQNKAIIYYRNFVWTNQPYRSAWTGKKR
jgi:hypothetical protein